MIIFILNFSICFVFIFKTILVEKSIMRSLITKLLIKYRVVVFKKESLEKLGSFYINKIHVGLFVFLIFLLSFFLSSLCLVLSPLGNKFFDFSNKHKISDLYLHVDSIENLLSLHLDYTEKLKLIFNDFDTLKQPISENVVFSIKSLNSRITKKDSSLVNYLQKLDEVSSEKYNKELLEKLKICSPTKGIVTSSYNIKDGHFGVDVAAKQNADVYSVLSGVVLFSGYSDDLGNFIVLAHENNFSSIYLHNSVLLKNKGDVVHAGEKIAQIGSTGKLSTAPHLHFELWSGAAPIDPEIYIQFN